MPEIIAKAPARAKDYEAIYILRPDIDAETASKVAGRVTEVIAREAGVLTKVESWGRRKIAYPVRKYYKGIYVYVRFLGSGGLVAEFERNLRMQKDAVLKFQTIKLSDCVETPDVKVDSDELKFAAVEPMSEEDKEESREKLLGLVDYEMHGRDYGRSRHERMDDVDDEAGLEDAEDEDEEKQS
jgi:small subunit ribosomal protein S6